MVSQGFFSGSASAEKRTTRFAGDKENTDTSNLKVESPSVQVANVKSYTDSTFTPSYPGDPYRDALRETDKPKKVDKKTYIQSRMAEKMYDGDIDKFKRKTLDYKTGTDFFGDKVDYSPETIKRYISTDAKENYEKDQAFEREKQLNEARRIAKQERKNIDDKAYVRAMQKFDKPSITQRVSNFVFGTDLKGKPDPRNPNILSKDERISTLRGVQRVYNEPGISVDPYGVLTRRNLGEQKPTSELSVKDFKAKENIERRKIFREQAGMSPNPNLMERTQNFLSGVADNVGNVVDNVSKIFTPKVEAGTLEGKPTRFTMGESNVPSMSTPSVGDMVSNIGAAVEAGGMGGLARPETSQKRSVRIGGISFPQSRFGRPQPSVKSPMEAGMGPGAARARAMAKARNAAKQSGTAAPSMSGADRAKALAKARIARKKKSTTTSGTGFGRSTSSSRRSTGRAGRRGGSAGSAGSRSRGSTGSASRRSSSSSRSSNTSRSRRGGQSSSRGGSFGGSRRRGGRRGRRGGRRCDIRCKINISPLINTNLVRDDLAELAYFVKEIK